MAVDREEHPGDYARRVIAFIKQCDSVSAYELSATFHWPKPYMEYAMRRLESQGYVMEAGEDE